MSPYGGGMNGVSESGTIERSQKREFQATLLLLWTLLGRACHCSLNRTVGGRLGRALMRQLAS